MASKKRKRSVDSCCSSSSYGERLGEGAAGRRESENKHELFLRAFEKPTQIYRYLRTRHLFSPIFLHRNLRYMKQRMSRKNKRKDFLLGSFTGRIQEMQNESQSDRNTGNLTISLIGVNDSSISDDKTAFMTIQVSIFKLCTKSKRKEPSLPESYSVGSYEVPINSRESTIAQVLTIVKDKLTSNGQGLVKSHSLVITATRKSGTLNKDGSQCDSLGNDCSEASFKRRKRIEFVYEAELVIFDNNMKCLLEAGEYQVVLKKRSSSKVPHLMQKQINSFAWQELDAVSNGCEENIQSLSVFEDPILRLKLSWNEVIGNGLIPNPPKLIPLPLANNSLLVNHDENWKSVNWKESWEGLNGVPKCLSSDLVKPSKSLVRVVYHFYFSNNTLQHTQANSNFRCPWCSINCMQLNPNLIYHLKLCHNRFKFDVTTENKGTKIDVTLNHCFDGSYSGNPYDLSYATTGFAFSRNGPVQRSPVTQLLVCHPNMNRSSSELMQIDPDDGDFDSNHIPAVFGHNRLYFHTNTCLPIRPQDMDVDSEAESDPEWMRIKTQLMIDEFTDVNEGEKEVMKLWNLHVMKHGFVGDCQMELACKTFVDDQGPEILKRNLYKNFLLHLSNLYDFGLINGSQMMTIIRRLLQVQMQSNETSPETSSAVKKEPTED